MPTSYLLPCSCGQKVPVESRQAGEVVECGCGRSLEVPTLLQMATLERTEPELEPRRSAKAWGARQSLSLLGAVVFVGALGAAGFLLSDRPPSPDPEWAKKPPELIRRQIKALTPLESRGFWQFLKVRGPDGHTPLEQARYEDILGRYHEARLRWWLSLGVVLTVGVVGLGLIVVPWWKK